MHDRIELEREFHDNWADSEDLAAIDVVHTNEVCTAPEMRFITKSLGDLNGKSLLDIGCGLGEASVYFALKGANVTASDLSPGMLDFAQALAKKNDVSINTHLASAEDMLLKPEQTFDVIYAGNVLHHVDLEKTISQLMPHLKDGGIFVSWDPVAYNPIINVYRAMATEVRTPDEAPLGIKEIRTLKKSFSSVKLRYFWLTTLLIFILMYVVQRRDPNKERFWKVVLKEGNKWAFLFKPLKLIDDILLKLIPPLGLLCWNVVVIARK